MVFDIEMDFIELFIFLSLLYGIVTFVPSPFLGNLGTREALALYIASTSTLGLFAPVISLIIWFINVGLSTFIGGVIYNSKNIKKI